MTLKWPWNDLEIIFKDNLASDVWISDLWFPGHTAMQMKFAK